MTYKDLILKLVNREPFSFMRFGDGEMKCVLSPSEDTSNCDGHKYFPSLSTELNKVLKDQNENQTSVMGLQSLGDGIFPQFKNRFPNIEWTDADIIHEQNEKSGLADMIDLAYRVIFVANPMMMQVKFNDPYKFISIPPKNAWLHYGEILDRITDLHPKDNVFFFAASMMSEVLIHKLHKMYPDCTFIDVGSALDPYAGVISRTYHTRMGFDKSKMYNPRGL